MYALFACAWIFACSQFHACSHVGTYYLRNACRPTVCSKLSRYATFEHVCTDANEHVFNELLLMFASSA